MKRFLFLLLLLATSTSVFSQEIIPLYPEGIKNHKDSDEEETHTNDQIFWITNIQEPTLEIYLPAKASATGKAVVICPGGGYGGLAYEWEGTDIAKWFNSKGIAAFVLKYRMPNSASVDIGRLAPLQDAQRAIRIVRSDADQWNINPDQIGVIGFSAGGHLASTLGTHFNFEDQRFFDPSTIDSVSAALTSLLLFTL
jgi:acetyl esterase/lipase